MHPLSPPSPRSTLPARPSGALSKAGTEPPAPETVDVLKSLGRHKRKVGALYSQAEHAGKRIRPEQYSERGLPVSGSEINPEERMQKIARLNPTCRATKITTLSEKLGIALGGPSMSAQRRDALMTAILGAHDTVSDTRLFAMFEGLCAALGVAGMSAEHRDGLMAKIVGSYATVSEMKVAQLVQKLSQALGGAQLTTDNRDALIAHIVIARKTCSFVLTGLMIQALGTALGGQSMAVGNRDAMIDQILGTLPKCRRLHLIHLIQGLGFSFGGRHMTALNRDELIRRILSVSTGCSDEQLGVMMRALCDTLGGRMMSRSSNAAFVAQILAAHATCRAGQLRAMFHPLSLSLEMETVLPDIMRAGASPMKTGMLLAAAIDCCACLASSRRLFASLLATIKVAPSHRAYVDAGFYAACGDIDRVLTIEGLNDDDKLDFICYSCVELMPLDETSMPLQLGNILFLDVSRSLKTRALVLVLAKGPANPACFKLVRQWLIGILADITDIEWVRRDDLVEIRGDSRDYALWETDLTALYRDFREEMTDDFIKQETQLISRHPLLPSDVQRKLLALLDEVQSRRLEMTLRWSPESPEMNPSPC